MARANNLNLASLEGIRGTSHFDTLDGADIKISTVLSMVDELLLAREVISRTIKKGFVSLSQVTAYEKLREKTDLTLLAGKVGFK